MTLGEKINLLRKQIKLSQAEFAEKIGVSRDAIGKYEWNDITPTIDRVIKMAETFNISIDFLVSSEDKQEELNKEAVKRIKEIQKLPESEKNKIFSVIDALIRDFKAKQAFGIKTP